ncbi:hypothetical protein [Aurantivibrio infirmus]
MISLLESVSTFSIKVKPPINGNATKSAIDDLRSRINQYDFAACFAPLVSSSELLDIDYNQKCITPQQTASGTSWSESSISRAFCG